MSLEYVWKILVDVWRMFWKIFGSAFGRCSEDLCEIWEMLWKAFGFLVMIFEDSWRIWEDV